MKLSVIFVHYSTDDYKSKIGEDSLLNLKKTLDESCELIVVNNGERDHGFSGLADTYIKNPKNALGSARNLGFDRASGDYICFIDNDVRVHKGWWQECIRLLEKYPDRKLIATPVHTRCHVDEKKRRWATLCKKGELDGNMLNTRSGSNCLLMKRSSFEDIGRFIETSQRYLGYDGTEFCNRQNFRGYLMILTNPAMADDVGIYRYKYET